MTRRESVKETTFRISISNQVFYAGGGGFPWLHWRYSFKCDCSNVYLFIRIIEIIHPTENFESADDLRAEQLEKFKQMPASDGSQVLIECMNRKFYGNG